MDEGLVERLRVAARRALADQPVVVAYLFGSRAAGRPRAASDTDVALLLDHPLAPGDRRDLLLGLADAFETAAGTEVDLVVLDDAPLPLRGRVLRDAVVLWSADEPRRVRYESLTRRMAADHALAFDRLDQMLLAETAAGRR